MSWLVTGGAGYIGSHVVRALLAAGERVAVLDDLSTGMRARVPDGVPFVEAGIADSAAVAEALRAHQVRGVVHLAAKKSAPESVERPLDYYRHNVEGMRALLAEVVSAGVRSFVFSSSAAVYGSPADPVVTEATATEPISPYGETKLVGEWLVAAVARAHGLRAVSLRYFNVAGAADALLADTGRDNLVPRVLDALDGIAPLTVFGDDWPTPDGTCLRDYVDVRDLAEAHVAAAAWLGTSGAGDEPHLAINIGTGRGASVREILVAAERAAGRPVPAQMGPRRAGDPAAVVARVDRAAELLGWRARRGVDETVASAWAARASAAD